jgi:hypothetical protein
MNRMAHATPLAWIVTHRAISEKATNNRVAIRLNEFHDVAAARLAFQQGVESGR